MSRRPAALPVLAALLALYLAAPLAAGLVRLPGADWRGADLSMIGHATAVSIASASVAALLIGLGGIPLGFVLARSDGRGVAALGLLVQLPLALPPLTSGVLLLFLVGHSRALTDSFAGIVLAETFVAAPFLVIAARSAFDAIDPDLERVAATLGHSPAAVFRRVSLPLAARGIAAGLLLAWLRAFGEFGATVMVAYHPYSLPVFTYVAFGGEGLPAMLPILAPTLAASLAILALSRSALRPGRRPIQSPVAFTPLARPVPARIAPAGPRLEFAATRALDGFTLDIAWHTAARRLAILGASGSGKSLTLRILAGLDRGGPTRLRLDGDDLARLPPERRRIGYVPQSYALRPDRTAASQIRSAADADEALAASWTERLGLRALQHRPPGALSLGQRQRVALARALARPDCRLLLLDEPFSALDATLRELLRLELRALQAELPATTILVTHDPADALVLADELLLLDGGRVIQSGPTDEIFARPASETAARLLGATNIAAGTAIAPDRIDLGGLVLPVGGPPLALGRVGWAVRPHQVRIVGAGEGLPASLLDAAPMRAGQRRLTVRLGDVVLDILADADAPVCGIHLRIDPDALQVWPDPKRDQGSALQPAGAGGPRPAMTRPAITP